MARCCFAVLMLALVLTIASCDLVDPMRPTPHADTETFGNLLETTPDPGSDGAWTVKVKIGVPRTLGRSDGAEPTPDVAGGITAVVLVTSDTVVIANDRPSAVEDINPGTEVVAVPVAGTTTMFGEGELHLEAAQLMDFESYARWRLPKLALSKGPSEVVEDENLINSSGVESEPVPVGDGRVLYFSARLRPPEVADGPWIGARRNGLSSPAEGGASVERSFRTELGDSGWSAPELVVFSNIGLDKHTKISWVSGDETRCYVTVTGGDGRPWVGVSERANRNAAWGEINRMETTGDGDAFGAVAMALSPEKTVFATLRNGNADLFLHDPALGPAQQLQAEINSGGTEWGPQVGPANELYFVRGDRQLRFQGGSVHELRLPGPHRTVFIEAAPTADGAWLFFSVPRYRPVELDLDIHVAPIADDGSLGLAVPVDEWGGE